MSIFRMLGLRSNWSAARSKYSLAAAKLMVRLRCGTFCESLMSKSMVQRAIRLAFRGRSTGIVCNCHVVGRIKAERTRFEGLPNHPCEKFSFFLCADARKNHHAVH